MEQKVYPIKDSNVLHDVQETLLNNFRTSVARRNYTIFQVGKATLLRVSDVLALKYADVYDEQGNVYRNDYIHDKKTSKGHRLYLKPVITDLNKYHQWLKENNVTSEWLFPSTRDSTRHITEKQYYKVMAHVGDLLGLDYLGTHTMRKTGAYRVYQQSNHDIALVMKLLKQDSEGTTLAYLGLDQDSIETRLDKIDFG